MLEAMRKHAKYFYGLFFIVILTFMFWGVGTVDKTTSVPVAEVGKEKISIEEFWRAYDRALELSKEVYKEKFNAEMEKKLRLKERVLDSLIEERVMLLAASSANIKVTDEELEEAITNDPTFKRDGVFNRDIYLRTLELNRITPQIYEAMKRRDLVMTEMARLVSESVDIEPGELKALDKLDDSTRREVLAALLNAKRELALKSFVEGARRQIGVKINNSVLPE